ISAAVQSHVSSVPLCATRNRKMSFVRSIVFICLACFWISACNTEPGPIEKIASTSNTSDSAAGKIPVQTEPRLEENSHRAEANNDAGEEDFSQPDDEKATLTKIELPESRIRFEVPADWKKVQPQNNIIEAEFELPRLEGDEYDGRLT